MRHDFNQYPQKRITTYTEFLAWVHTHYPQAAASPDTVEDSRVARPDEK